VQSPLSRGTWQARAGDCASRDGGLRKSSPASIRGMFQGLWCASEFQSQPISGTDRRTRGSSLVGRRRLRNPIQKQSAESANPQLWANCRHSRTDQARAGVVNRGKLATMCSDYLKRWELRPDGEPIITRSGRLLPVRMTKLLRHGVEQRRRCHALAARPIASSHKQTWRNLGGSKMVEAQIWRL
jgi:hypothetical protein